MNRVQNKGSREIAKQIIDDIGKFYKIAIFHLKFCPMLHIHIYLIKFNKPMIINFYYIIRLALINVIGFGLPFMLNS